MASMIINAHLPPEKESQYRKNSWLSWLGKDWIQTRVIRWPRQTRNSTHKDVNCSQGDGIEAVNMMTFGDISENNTTWLCIWIQMNKKPSNNKRKAKRNEGISKCGCRKSKQSYVLYLGETNKCGVRHAGSADSVKYNQSWSSSRWKCEPGGLINNHITSVPSFPVDFVIFNHPHMFYNGSFLS